MTDIKARVDEFFAEMDASPALEREVFDRIKRRIDKRLDDLDRMDRLADQRMDRLNDEFFDLVGDVPGAVKLTKDEFVRIFGFAPGDAPWNVP